jgi:hypothetical protein
LHTFSSGLTRHFPGVEWATELPRKWSRHQRSMSEHPMS